MLAAALTFNCRLDTLAFGTAIDRGPIRFLHLSPHHEGDLGGQQIVRKFFFFRGESRQRPWAAHYQSTPFSHCCMICLKVAKSRNSRSCPKDCANHWL